MSGNDEAAAADPLAVANPLAQPFEAAPLTVEVAVSLRLAPWTASKSRWKARSSEAWRPSTCFGKRSAGIFVSGSPYQPLEAAPDVEAMVAQYFRGVNAMVS